MFFFESKPQEHRKISQRQRRRLSYRRNSSQRIQQLCLLGGLIGCLSIPCLFGSHAAVGIQGLKDWKFEGQVAKSGWSGSASCGLGEGQNLKLHASGLRTGKPSEIGASLNYKLKEGGPSLQLTGSLKPNAASKLKQKVSFSAGLRQRFKFRKDVGTILPWLEVGALLSQGGPAVDAELRQPCGEDLDLALKLRVAENRKGKRTDFNLKALSATAAAEASYNLAGGRLVGSLTKQAEGGTQVSATYRLG
eukprot:TRINITY_DN4104_c0_g3_i3.p1 TRINITY_DN4104_c0_g3~~TRINITY_DN4104_c0_g3_i3.p1  ORF type:complete len:259 (+),score=35.39 TRINITY_DN4104_c0_g3_i3:31-777(+)